MHIPSKINLFNILMLRQVNTWPDINTSTHVPSINVHLVVHFILQNDGFLTYTPLLLSYNVTRSHLVLVQQTLKRWVNQDISHFYSVNANLIVWWICEKKKIALLIHVLCDWNVKMHWFWLYCKLWTSRIRGSILCLIRMQNYLCFKE